MKLKTINVKIMAVSDHVKQVAIRLLKFELDQLENDFIENKMVGKNERVYYQRKKNLQHQISHGINLQHQISHGVDISTLLGVSAMKIDQKYSANITQHIEYRKRFPAIIYYQDALDRMLEKLQAGIGVGKGKRDLEKKIELYNSKINAILNYDGIWQEEATWVRCDPSIVTHDWDIGPIYSPCDKCDGIGFTVEIQSTDN